VTLLNAAPAELELRIEREASRPQADVFFTTDAAGAERLRQKSLLQPYQSPNAARVPAEFKAPDGAWTGMIGRSRSIMYNTNLVKPEEAPKSVFDLTDPKYRGRVAISAITEGGTKLWLASLLQERGEEFTVKYVNDLRANGLRVLANSTEVRKEVGGGGVAYGLVNHYYYVFEQKEGKPVGLIYPDQDAGQIGTLVTPLTVSIVKGARNEEAARRFVDFVLSAEGQAPLTTQEAEFPLVPGVGLGDANVPGVRPIDQIKRPTTDFAKLADFERRAVELFGPILVPGVR
jgi:iron(III) transport system substrate-binding protein